MGNWKTLELRDLDDMYIKTNKSTRRILYFNGDHKNLIVVYPCDKCVDEEDIFNGITEYPYQYLMKNLSENNNIVVVWSAVEGTTSDYTIYYDAYQSGLERKGIKEVFEYLHTLYEDAPIGMKYQQVLDGKRTAITREMMGRPEGE